jgi:flagellar basal body-associated protein FliL
MADEFSEDFLDEDELQKPKKIAKVPESDKNKLWIILVVALIQTILAIFIVDQFVLPARSELLEANEELLLKVQQERLAIEKKISQLNALQLSNGMEVEEPKTDLELTGLDASKQGDIHEIQNIIVNPLGSNGEQVVLLSVGLEFNTLETSAYMKTKEVIMKDRVLNIIANKRIEDIDENNEQVKLRNEIKESISKYLPEEGELYNVYISNFVVQ